MLFDSSKLPLPRGQSYPINAHALNEALVRLGVANVRKVKWLKSGRSIYKPFEAGVSHPVVEAQYDGLAGHDGHRVMTHLPDPGHVVLHVYSVPSSERRVAEDLLSKTGLPAAAEWLARAQTETETWRSSNHDFYLYFVNGDLATAERGPGSSWRTISPREAPSELI